MAVALALVSLVLFYPGILQGDSLWQWQQALARSYSCWHPPLQAKLMSLTWRVSHGPALFTFVQACAFWASCLGVWAILFEGRSWTWVAPFALTSVLFWSYAATTMKDVWTAAFLNLTVVLLVVAARRRSVAAVLAAFAAVGTMWAFRDNAATVVAAPAATYLFLGRRRWWMHAAILAVALLLTLAPKYLSEHSRNVFCGDRQVGKALVAQYIGALKHIEQERGPGDGELLATETRRFERVHGPGSLGKALVAYRCFTADPLHQYSFEADPLLSGLAHVALHAPTALLEHKACNFAHFAGAGGEYWPVTWRGIQQNDLGDAFVARSKAPAAEALYFERLLPAVGTGPYRLITYVPVFLAAIALGLRRRPRDDVLLLAALAAACYVLSFAIADAHPQFRYSSPAVILGWLLTLRLLADLVAEAGRRLRG